MAVCYHSAVGILRQYNLRPEEFAKQILQFRKEQEGLYGSIRVRCAATYDEQNKHWKNALALINLWPAGDFPQAEEPRRYPELLLLEQWHNLDALGQVLDQICVGRKLLLHGEEVMLDPNSTLSHREFHPRENWYSPLSGWVYEAGRGQGPNIPSEPLLAPRLPFYTDGFHAMQGWFGLPHLSHNDARIGEVLVFFPECRAGIGSVGLDEAGRVTVQPRFGHERFKQGMELKGAWLVGESRRTFEMPFEGEATLALPEGATGFCVYMVGANATIYDFHDEMARWVRGGQRVLGGHPSNNISEIVQRALRTGECDVVEYKPFVEMGNPKQDEIIESVIAFANTKGGSVLFGIDKHCAIIGIEQELHRIARTNGEGFDTVVDKYKGWLRRLIGDSLNRSIVPDFDLVAIEGHKVLALLIPEGKEKPYARVRSNDIWVRKGSNNVRPDPDTDLPELLEPPESYPGAFGTVPLALPRRQRRR